MLSVVSYVAAFCLGAYSETVELPSSCLGQEDGYTWLKLLDGAEYPLVHQKCQNEHLIIDVAHDPSVKQYFSSWDAWHTALGGPEMMDFANWEQWWTPNARFLDTPTSQDEFFSYIISPQCDVCDLRANSELNPYAWSNSDNSTNTSRTAYYMTGTMFTCLHRSKAMKDCRWDYDTYECFYCSLTDSDGDLGYTVIPPEHEWFDNYTKTHNYATDNSGGLMISLCGVYPQAANSDEVPQNRNECNSASNQNNIKPSIGTKGQFCQCAKPNPSAQASTFTVSLAWLARSEAALARYQSQLESETDQTSDTVIELYQRDFESGTYRITESGTYVVMEDIIFDFNAGDVEDPNAEWAWWPLPEQSDEYNGAGSTRDEYYMGFFAGITVEADDVTLDLNGHEIAQSPAFYYQQRFFACVALKSVVFALQQGPGVFGADPKFASDVTIKNGAIGLSSHFGIHGQNNERVRIENVHIHSFETHGVEMSYYKGLEMYNVEIGPSSRVAFLKGEYGYGRWLLQKIEMILADPHTYANGVGPEDELFPFTFDGRDREIRSLGEMADNLRELMDIAFKSVMDVDHGYAEDDERFLEAKSLFINDDGLPYGAVLYGLFLNLYVANVFKIHPSMKHSDGAVIENLYIHGLHHKMDEYIRLDKANRFVYKNPFDAGLDAEAMLGSDQLFDNAFDELDWSTVHYKGSALTDVTIVLDMVSEHWGIAGFSRISENMWRWSIGNLSWTEDGEDVHPYLGCNNDRMTHVAKGVVGIRMDGTDNVHFDNLEISDLVEYSELGSNVCGEYWDEDFHGFGGKGHFLQNAPYLYGYTGNMAHGLFTDWARYSLSGEVSIHGLESHTGLVRAVGMYVNTSLDISDVDSLAIYDLTAGSALLETNTSALAYPYAPAIAKVFHILDNYSDAYNHTFYSPLIGDPRVVSASCVFGVEGIDDDWDAWSLEFVLGANQDADCTLFERDDTLFAAREVVLSSARQSAHWLIVMLIGGFACAALSIYTLCGQRQRKSLLVADGQRRYGSF